MERGLYGTYSNHGCRCDECKKAWSEKMKELRQKRLALTYEEIPNHGKYTTYSNYGCRCDDCSTAWKVYWRERNERKRAEA